MAEVGRRDLLKAVAAASLGVGLTAAAERLSIRPAASPIATPISKQVESRLNRLKKLRLEYQKLDGQLGSMIIEELKSITFGHLTT